MNLKYKILSIDEQEQSMVVRFYTDKITEMMVAVRDGQGNIPVDAEGKPLRCRTDMNITFGDAANRPKGAALEAYIIKRFAPWTFLDMKEKVADPQVDTSLSDLIPFIGQERGREVDIIDGQVTLKPRP